MRNDQKNPGLVATYFGDWKLEPDNEHGFEDKIKGQVVKNCP